MGNSHCAPRLEEPQEAPERTEIATEKSSRDEQHCKEKCKHYEQMPPRTKKTKAPLEGGGKKHPRFFNGTGQIVGSKAENLPGGANAEAKRRNLKTKPCEEQGYENQEKQDHELTCSKVMGRPIPVSRDPIEEIREHAKGTEPTTGKTAQDEGKYEDRSNEKEGKVQAQKKVL